jgi:hypothetical protein
MNDIKRITLYLARVLGLTVLISMIVGPAIFSERKFAIVSDVAIWLSVCCGDEGTFHLAADLVLLISLLLAVSATFMVDRFRRRKARTLFGEVE